MSSDREDEELGDVSLNTESAMETTERSLPKWFADHGFSVTADSEYAENYSKGQRMVMDEETHAVMPPWEKYACVPAEKRAEFLRSALSPGELVVCKLVEIDEMVFLVKVLAIEPPKKRWISDVELIARLPVTKLKKNPGDEVPYGFAVDDFVRCEVWRIGDGGVALSMLGEVADKTLLKNKPLGKIDVSDASLAEWRSSIQGTYDEDLQAIPEFNNPGALQPLAERFGLRVAGRVEESREELKGIVLKQCQGLVRKILHQPDQLVDEEEELSSLMDMFKGLTDNLRSDPTGIFACCVATLVSDPEACLAALVLLREGWPTMPLLEECEAIAYLVLARRRHLAGHVESSSEALQRSLECVPGWCEAQHAVDIIRWSSESPGVTPEEGPLGFDCNPEPPQTVDNLRQALPEGESIPVGTRSRGRRGRDEHVGRAKTRATSASAHRRLSNNGVPEDRRLDRRPSDAENRDRRLVADEEFNTRHDSVLKTSKHRNLGSPERLRPERVQVPVSDLLEARKEANVRSSVGKQRKHEGGRTASVKRRSDDRESDRHRVERSLERPTSAQQLRRRSLERHYSGEASRSPGRPPQPRRLSKSPGRRFSGEVDASPRGRWRSPRRSRTPEMLYSREGGENPRMRSRSPRLSRSAERRYSREVGRGEARRTGSPRSRSKSAEKQYSREVGRGEARRTGSPRSRSRIAERRYSREVGRGEARRTGSPRSRSRSAERQFSREVGRGGARRTGSPRSRSTSPAGQEREEEYHRRPYNGESAYNRRRSNDGTQNGHRFQQGGKTSYERGYGVGDSRDEWPGTSKPRRSTKPSSARQSPNRRSLSPARIVLAQISRVVFVVTTVGCNTTTQRLLDVCNRHVKVKTCKQEKQVAKWNITLHAPGSTAGELAQFLADGLILTVEVPGRFGYVHPRSAEQHGTFDSTNSLAANAGQPTVVSPATELRSETATESGPCNPRKLVKISLKPISETLNQSIIPPPIAAVGSAAIEDSSSPETAHVGQNTEVNQVGETRPKPVVEYVPCGIYNRTLLEIPLKSMSETTNQAIVPRPIAAVIKDSSSLETAHVVQNAKVNQGRKTRPKPTIEYVASGIHRRTLLQIPRKPISETMKLPVVPPRVAAAESATNGKDSSDKYKHLVARTDIPRDPRAYKYILEFSIPEKECKRWLSATKSAVRVHLKRLLDGAEKSAGKGQLISEVLSKKIKFFKALLEDFPIFTEGGIDILKEYSV